MYFCCSVDVWDVAEFGVGPEVFDVVELALVWHEDVYDDVGIVHCHPDGIVHSGYGYGFCFQPVATGFADGLCEGCHLLW